MKDIASATLTKHNHGKSTFFNFDLSDHISESDTKEHTDY